MRSISYEFYPKLKKIRSDKDFVRPNIPQIKYVNNQWQFHQVYHQLVSQLNLNQKLTSINFNFQLLKPRAKDHPAPAQ